MYVNADREIRAINPEWKSYFSHKHTNDNFQSIKNANNAFGIKCKMDPSCSHVPQNNIQVSTQIASKAKSPIQPAQQQKFNQQQSQQPQQQKQQGSEALPPQQIPNQPQQQQQQQLSANSTAPNNNGNNDTVTPMDVRIEDIMSHVGVPVAGVDDRKTFFKKMFAYRKKSSLRAKEKKIRQNRNLRKVILPKNALMALNEVKGVHMGDFIINSVGVGGGFSALVTINNIQYEGRGLSKALAKNNACEKALRDIVLAKMGKTPRPINATKRNAEEPMDTTDETIESENTQSNDNDGGKVSSSDDDSDVPMVNLASFALYKLFSEWENDGFHIPEFHNGAQGPAADKQNASSTEKLPKKVTIKTELPENWETLHPATLLCMMRPGLTYCNWGTEGEAPNQIQSLSVAVDNEVFVGSGRSKKIARKNAAINACNKLFGTNFVKQEI